MRNDKWLLKFSKNKTPDNFFNYQGLIDIF